MPPKTPITSSLGEVKARVSDLERLFQQLQDRVHLIELPGDTVAQEIERLRRNAERTLEEMRGLRESICACGRTTKDYCKMYTNAMQSYFERAEASIISHKEENKKQRMILNKFVFDTEKQMAKAQDIKLIIGPLQKDVDALKQMKDQASVALQDMDATAKANVEALTDRTLTEEVLGYIPEFGEANEVHEITDLHKRFDMLEKRVAAFEETVFAGSHATPQTNPGDVLRGRMAVSQRAAENRARSTRSRSSSCGE